MLRSIPWTLFEEWYLFDKMHPIGELRGDWQIAALCSLIANIEASKGKRRRKRFRAQDFLLDFGLERPKLMDRQQSWQEQKMIAMMFAAAGNAKGKQRGRRT